MELPPPAPGADANDEAAGQANQTYPDVMIFDEAIMQGDKDLIELQSIIGESRL